MINLLLPGPPLDGAEGVWVTISCGTSEKEFVFKGHFGWHTLEINAESDSEGILEIDIFSSTWSPDAVFNNGDKRILGCAVEAINFKAINNTESLFQVSSDALDGQDLTVIIPTYNRKEVLKEALASLMKQTLKNFNVIVVDDGSTDGTMDFMNLWRNQEEANLHFSIKFLTQENQKQGQARNYGLKSVDGGIVMFIGDDILLEPDCLQIHMGMHKKMNIDGSMAVVGFTDWDREKMDVSPFLDFINNFGAQFGYKLMSPGEEVPFTCFYTSHISMSMSVLGDNPFDSCFKEYGWEDIDLGYRLSREGLKIIYVPEARARHLHPTDMISFFNRQRKVGFAVETLFKRHPELRYSRYLPTFSYPWTSVLLSPVWSFLVRCIDFLDRRSQIKFSQAMYHSLVSHPFHKGWSERVNSTK
ncbi:MAG: glycosyltransferase family 2 protein [Desulfamplus sp.]|nr:glycosyltransferase family 2 protein [Desulfamplus sp.]